MATVPVNLDLYVERMVRVLTQARWGPPEFIERMAAIVAEELARDLDELELLRAEVARDLPLQDALRQELILELGAEVRRLEGLLAEEAGVDTITEMDGTVHQISRHAAP